MKVLFIVDRLGAGGKERQLVELLKGLTRMHRIACQLIVLSSQVHYSELEELEIEVHLIDRKSKIDYDGLRKVFKVCRLFRPDLIHSWESLASIYALPASKYFRIKLINSIIRNAPTNIPRLSQTWIRTRFLLRFSEITLANSKAGLEAYNIPMDKRHFIYNGFDFNRINNLEPKDQIRSRFGITSPLVVGMVGKFTDKKDYKTFILAAIQVLKRRNDVHFITIGDGKYLEACKKLGQHEHILFLGNQIQVESIVNVFNIGVLATFTEGISNSIMEFMALSKPVIATDGGGTSEILIDGVTGFLVAQGDVEDLASRIETLLENRELANRMGDRGKQRLQDNFNLDKMTEQMTSLYQKCIDTS